MRIPRSLPFQAFILCVFLMPLAANGQTAGPSVNMVSGTGWTNGDPFLQRQNEPSLAVSTRNTLHLLGGANDYRSVDIAGLAGQDYRADAWLGIFKSFDGGQTWQSTLLPGFPLDSSPTGMASPLHGFQAAADPTVRAGTNGLFYYSGIAFNRGTNAPGVVFVARFIDNDNKENGDATHTNGSLTNLAPTDPIQYLGTVIVDSGNSGQFLDKPWIATDIPRGIATCTVPYTKPDGTQGTQTIPAGTVYLAYTSFNGNQQDTRIMFASSSDCGATWSKPVKLSESNSVNQGTIIVVDPSSANNAAATIYVAWRRFATSSQPDAMEIVKSTDGGKSFTKSIDAVVFPMSCSTTLPPNPPPAGCPFDQGTTGTSFRTEAFPALTVDDTGRVYLAWSQRQLSGDGRIMMNVSPDGVNWSSAPALVDHGPVLDDSGNPFSNLSGRGHQLMPSLSFSAGKLSLAYLDLREDHTLGVFTVNPDLSSYDETRQLEGELIGDPASSLVFNPFVSDAAPPLTTRRHTVDIQGAEATPLAPGSLGVPSFIPFRISRYLFGINPFGDSSQAEQLQVDAPDLPMFEQGTVPFFGDYIDIAPAPPFLVQNGKWIFNTNSANLPVFHAAWTDNRDVVPPPDGNWTHYEPPYSASNPAGTTNMSVFDPTQTVTPCVVGVNDGFIASRNQNIYTSIVAPGLVVGSLGNSKPLGFSAANPTQLLQRAFTITLRNTTTLERTFRISIANQPALANGQPDPQGQASLLQFSFLPSLDVTIPAQSSIARAVFIQSANPTASVTVNAQEISAPGGSLITGGLQGFVTFNPDPAAPLLLDPDNFGFANPAILSAETHNPAIANPAIANPAIANPAIANPAIANPAIANPAIANPAIANPDLIAALNPAIANPAIANPAIANPAIANPAIANQSVTDATYPVSNVGNTTTSYAVKLFQKAPLPTGVKLQLILTKQYLVPVAQGCDLKQQIQNVVVASIPNPAFTPASSLGDPDLPDPAVTNATMALNPGETGQIIIRANTSDPAVMQNILSNVLVPVAVAHPANTGMTAPSATLAILSSTLPDGVVGKAYSGQINIFGGFGTHTVSITSGSLPTGLNLDANSGLISGTPASAGSFTFMVQVADSFTPPAVATQAFTLNIANPLAISSPGGTDGIVNVPYSLTLNTTGGTGNETWTLLSGTLPIGFSFSTAGVISGTPTTPNLTGNTVTFQVQDSGSPAQIATVSLTIRIASLLSITTTPGQLPDAVFGDPYSFTFQSSGGFSPIGWTVASGQPPAGLSLNSNGTVSGTPTSTGSYPFTIQAADGSSPSQTITLNVAIKSAPLLVINTAGGALPDAVVGNAYNVALQAAGGTSPFTWTITSGQLPTGLTLSTAGVLSGTPTTASGTPVSFTVQVQDSGSPAQTKSLSPTIRVTAPLLITTPTGALPDAVANTPYSVTLSSTGGLAPLTWTLTNGTLPNGLTLSPTGTLSGTPTQVNTMATSLTVQAKDSISPAQTTSVVLSVRVAPPLAITTSSGLLPDAVQGASYTFALQASGGITPLTWSLPAGQFLPPGLMLGANGVISGIPTTVNTLGTTFSTRVQDASVPAQLKTQSYTIRVPAPLVILPASGALPDALATVAYTTTLTTTGGIGGVTWSLSSGALPPGMALSTTGVISGTSSAVGNYSFTVHAVDSGSPQQKATASYTLTVASNFTVSFAVQPSNTKSQTQITPSVKVLVVDNFGNAVRGAVVQITIAVNPGGGTLTGLTVQTTGQGGIAVFGSLGINGTGTGYQLKATVISPSNGNGAFAISAPFNVY
jgi:Putative Ig domain